MRLLAGVAAVSGCILAASALRGANPIDAALPFMGLVIAIQAVIVSRFAEHVLLAIPILIVVALGIPEETVRMLGYGIVVAAAFAVAFAGLSERLGEAIEPWRAIGFVLGAAAILRAIPLAPATLLPLVILMGGLAALIFIFGRPGVAPHVLPVMMAVSIVTPIAPFRMALFPVLLAFLIRGIDPASASRLIWLGAAIAIAAIAGKWALLLAGVVIIFQLPRLSASFRETRGSGMAATGPLVTGAAAVAARVFAFSPAVVADARVARSGLVLPAIALAVIAILTRPAISLLYLATAVVLLLPPGTSANRFQLSVPSLFAGLFAMVMLAWSGILAPLFPVPLDTITLLVIAAGLTLAVSVRMNWISALIAPAILVFVVATQQPQRVSVQSIGQGVGPGEAVVIRPYPNRGELALILTGSNLTGVSPRAVVAAVELVDAQGRGYKREVRMSELADWGAFRSDHFFSSRNVLPRSLAGRIENFGSRAFLTGHGRISFRLPQPVATIRFSGSSALPRQSRVEFDHLEQPTR